MSVPSTPEFRPGDPESVAAMLRQLEETGADLPRQTVFAMVFGALRVRLMRSVVTMGAVVLAIAFLSYTGLSNMLESNLAHGLTRIEQLAVASPGRADLQQQAIDLRQTLRRAGISVETTLAGDPLDTWLILMALLTCTVGIANAMLMSVTERFREIATMKCLGAQDGLVVKMFLLESSLLGMIGALIGIALGIVVALATAGLQFGGYALSYFPWAEGWIVIGLSILAGMLLSVIGAVYPAILAARMRPVDALRVDE